jgi:ATP-binding cassette subfamily F protein 3
LEPDWPQAKQRGLAARLGFGHEKVETKVESLSGGEKVRLSLGLIAHAKPHALILDEPTSHLDIDSREALIHAVNAYTGAVMLITHDVYLAEACADRLWLVKDGHLRQYDGDLSEYRTLILSADRRQSKGAAREAPASKSKPVGPSRFTLERKLKEAEAELEQTQEALAHVDADLAKPETYAGNPARASALAQERAKLVEVLAAAEEAWLAAGEALSGLDAE